MTCYVGSTILLSVLSERLITLNYFDWGSKKLLCVFPPNVIYWRNMPGVFHFVLPYFWGWSIQARYRMRCPAWLKLVRFKSASNFHGCNFHVCNFHGCEQAMPTSWCWSRQACCRAFLPHLLHDRQLAGREVLRPKISEPRKDSHLLGFSAIEASKHFITLPRTSHIS